MGTTNAVPGVSPRPKLPRKPKSKSAGTEAAKAQLSQVLENHVSHIKAHLERVREGHSIVNEPEKVYLGHTEGESFWEVLGLRLAGHPLPILAAFPSEDSRSQGSGMPASPSPPTCRFLPQRSGRTFRSRGSVS